jgi:hypothetical protein
MKTKEKAQQLVDNFIDKMFYLRDGYNASEVFATAKQCALIAVDEIINQCWDYREIDLEASYNYWDEVRQEIINL